MAPPHCLIGEQIGVLFFQPTSPNRTLGNHDHLPRDMLRRVSGEDISFYVDNFNIQYVYFFTPLHLNLMLIIDMKTETIMHYWRILDERDELPEDES